MRVGLFVLVVVVGGSSSGHTITQKDKQFSHAALTIQAADSVTFKNSDVVAHNVFSRSAANVFNLKAQAPGTSSSVAFEHEGIVEVRCAIHPMMRLTITVTE
jgi:plastocyanin